MVETGRQSPTVRRRRLGAELRRLRVGAAVSTDEVAATLRCDGSKISRIENGRVGVRAQDLNDMLDLYGVSDPEHREALAELARAGRQKGWWQEHGDSLSKQYAVYIGLEADATALACYEPNVVHGLLQTEEYTLAVMRSALVERADVTRRVAVRLARQKLLDGPSPPRLRVVLDEATLHRQVGGPTVMSRQLDLLADRTRLPSVALHVLPYRIGGHPGLQGGPFSILEFPEPDPPMVYLEGLRSDVYVDKPGDVDWFTQVFEHLCASALSPADSADLILQIRKEIT